MRLRTVVAASFIALGSMTAPIAWAETKVAPIEAMQGEAAVLALSETLNIGPLFDVLHEEGKSYGKALEEDMFPGGGGPGWIATVEAIYDTATLRARFDAALVAELSSDSAAVADMVAFFGSDRGQRILKLEIEARRALLDTAVEEGAQVTADKMRAARDPRVGQVTRLAEAGDLIEMNVAGALSGNLAFLQGMAQEGIYGEEVDQDQMMSDVWGQEEQIRADTTTWLYPFLLLAYEPLSDADLEAYIKFSESASGHRLNAALFTAFDTVFKQVSYDLGRAAGRAMQGSDI